MNDPTLPAEAYCELARKLKDSREHRGISIDTVCRRTRLRRDIVLRMENGDLDFTTPLFVKGYLRQIAETVGLDGSEVVTDYERIRQKIHFVSQDLYLVPVGTVFPDEQSVPPEDPVRESDPTEMLSLDDKVLRKIAKEKRMNRLMTWGGVALAGLCLAFLLLDHRDSAVDGVPEVDQAVAEPQGVLTASKLRKKWQLSDPILSEQELAFKKNHDDIVRRDSVIRAKNLQNQAVSPGKAVRSITVQEAGEDLHKKVTGTSGPISRQ